MQMALVGRGHPLTFGGPADDGEERVEDRHTQDEERNEEGRQEEVGLTRGVGGRVGVGAAPHHAGRHRHEQAEQQSSAVAHEDLGRIEVVRQEADAHTESDDGDERADVGLQQRTQVVEAAAVEEEGGRRDGHDAGGQAIQAVDQVDGLGHADHPEDRDERDPVVREHEDVEERDSEIEHRDAEPHQHQRGDHGAGHLGHARHLAQIVEQAGREDHGGGEQHAEGFGVVVEDEGEPIHLPGQAEGGGESDEHGDAAHVGGGPGVDAALVGLDDPAPQVGDTDDDGRGDEGDDGGDRADQHIARSIRHACELTGVYPTRWC